MHIHAYFPWCSAEILHSSSLGRVIWRYYNHFPHKYIYIHSHIHRENKGLNIFNSAYVLADPKTATDVVTKTNNEKRDYMICITITTLTLLNTSDRTSREFWAWSVMNTFIIGVEIEWPCGIGFNWPWKRVWPSLEIRFACMYVCMQHIIDTCKLDFIYWPILYCNSFVT